MKTSTTIPKAALYYLLIGYWMLLISSSSSQIVASEISKSEEKYTPHLKDISTSKREKRRRSHLKRKNQKKDNHYLRYIGSATIGVIVGCTMTKKSKNSAVTEAPPPVPFTVEDQIEKDHDTNDLPNFDISLDGNVTPITSDKEQEKPSYSHFSTVYDNQSSVEKETDSSNDSPYTPNVIHACSSRYCAFFSPKSKCEHC